MSPKMSPKCRQIKSASNPCGSRVSETLSQILALGTLWGVVVRRQVACPPPPNFLPKRKKITSKRDYLSQPRLNCCRLICSFLSSSHFSKSTDPTASFNISGSSFSTNVPTSELFLE